jgi:hypothetical protein
MTNLWRKSTHSTGVDDEACVEVAKLTNGIGVRDSKNPDAGHLTLITPDFTRLVRRIKRGDLTCP